VGTMSVASRTLCRALKVAKEWKPGFLKKLLNADLVKSFKKETVINRVKVIGTCQN